MKLGRYIIYSGILLFFLLITPSNSFAQAPDVQNFSNPTPASGKYQKIEWVFDLSNAYTNPYYFYDSTDTPANNPSTMEWFGVDGISVDMHLTSPSGKVITVPGFWMEDYTRVKDSSFSSQGNEVLGKKDSGRWHIRFGPSETGTYQYYITAQDKSGTGRFPLSGTQSFTVANSSKKGFVRASLKDSRFLAYEDGSSFVPIGAGRQWWGDNVARSFDYENTFTKFGQNGVNITRMWDEVDFALSVEGASQPLWLDQNSVYGPAQITEVATANVHNGLRSARPTPGKNWYQRVAFTEPARQHKLTVWIKTDTVSGGVAQVNVRTGMGFNSGTLLGQTAGLSGTTGWTQYSFTFTPNNSVGSVNLMQTAGTGVMYVDDIALGPTDASGNIIYNILSDEGFERHFYKGVAGNDPDADPLLPRPLGSYMNPWASYEMDKIVESAEANGVHIQDCTCSGPWFTWPEDYPQGRGSWDWTKTWVLKSEERNFRYRVARWGYSPAILSWEFWNEMGHVNPSGTPGFWSFLQNFIPYQIATDPYNHIKTTSQNSQAYSPQMWSTFYNLANYHWYLDGHISTLDPDEALTINRFARCLTDIVRSTSSPYCQGLGLGDGTTWSGPAKPWVWGEIGVGVDGTQGNTLEAGSRFLHNKTWAGLFSPIGTTPLEWWWYQEDTTATNAKFAGTKAASSFFSNVDYDGGNFSFIMTSGDTPPGYTGETLSSTDPKARVYAMKRADKKAIYAWVQHKDYIWSKSGITPVSISPTLTFSNMLNTDTYNVSLFSTTTGAQISTTQKVPSSGNLTVDISNLTQDIAVKIESTTLPLPSQATPDQNSDGKVNAVDLVSLILNFNSNTYKKGDLNGNGTIDFSDIIQLLRML